MTVPSFWAGKRVFVTGHTGFKGSWLSLWLQRLGAEVCGYALDPPTEPSLFERLGLESGLRSVRADLADLEHLAGEMEGFRPALVFHLAAQSLVLKSYQEPVETYATNVLGTVHLLEAVRRCPGVRAVVVVTSDKCYRDEASEAGYAEGDALGGHDPYASSKACAELVASAWRDSYFPPHRLAEHGVGLATVRAGNVIGGGDWAENRLVPDLIRGFLAGESVAIRRPDSVRPWQHVLEPLSGYLRLARELHEGDASRCGAWNFGPRLEDSQPASRLATRLAELWGPPAAWHADEVGGAHETRLLKVDWTKAREQLGWRPRWGLEQALASVVAWHRAQAASSSPEATRAATEADIEAYEAAALHEEAGSRGR
jgi:CDP-glucose 4,6-dehydratase